MKTCTKCGTEKALEEFPIGKTCKDGREGRCRKCQSDYHKAWHAANSSDPEYILNRRIKGRDAQRKVRDQGKIQRLTKEQQKAARDRERRVNSHKMKARAAANRAIKRGDIVPIPCWCGETKVEAHHPSYAKEDWLRVVFYCHEHHHAEHVRIRAEALLKSVQPCPSH